MCLTEASSNPASDASAANMRWTRASSTYFLTAYETCQDTDPWHLPVTPTSNQSMSTQGERPSQLPEGVHLNTSLVEKKASMCSGTVILRVYCMMYSRSALQFVSVIIVSESPVLVSDVPCRSPDTRVYCCCTRNVDRVLYHYCDSRLHCLDRILCQTRPDDSDSPPKPKIKRRPTRTRGARPIM